MADTNTDENERSQGDSGAASASASPGDDQAALEMADDAALAAETDIGTDAAAVTSLLGPERWVQFGFIAMGFAIFYFVDKVATLVWERFAEPDPMITALSAAVLGLVGAFLAYRNPKSRKLADEVVSELSQVTWPSRDETYVSTIVVVVTSVVAAVYTGVFDALWSAITDYVYTI